MSIQKFEITQSMLGLFEKCGKAFEFRYLSNIIAAPKAALTVGRSVDRAVEVNLTQKIISKEDLFLETVLDAASTAFDKEAPHTDWQGEDSGKTKDVAIQLASAFHQTFAPQIDPVAVQKKLSVELEEYSLGGTIDYIESDETICDSKTSKGSYDDNAVAKSTQSAMYTLLYEKTHGHAPKGFRFDVLIKPTLRLPVRTEQRFGQVPEHQKTMLLKRADVLNNAIKTGNFHYASEQGWWCQRKWCGYWDICERGGKR